MLRRRDYTQRQLQEKLEAKFGKVPQEIVSQLVQKRFLNDKRYVENFIGKHTENHPDWVRQALEDAGVARETIDPAIDAYDWPSLPEVLRAKMQNWRLRPPLERRDVARLFRLLS